MANQKKTILICDDDDGILEVMRLVLEEKGFVVVVQPNCNSIKKWVATYQPSLIILDLWMRDKAGETITKELKLDPRTKTIPTLIISANKDIEEIAKDIGADGWLSKPFDIAELENLVQRHISGR